MQRQSWSIVLGIFLAVVSAQPAEPGSFASDRYAVPGVAYGAAGKKLNFYCIGSGRPAVILDAGLGDWSPSWTTIHDTVARLTTVCTFDRAGYGFSDTSSDPRTSSATTNELYSALMSSPIKPPYILVGHSYGGIVCTSSNAGKILQWSFARREKVLFFPDQHLGRWSGHKLGIPLEEMLVWDPDEPLGGLTPEQIRSAKILLWKGHCSVHQMFQPQHVLKFRNQHPDGLVISHPECSFEVCKLSDYVGSTETIIRTITEAPPNTRWLVGTELNLVNRVAEDMKPQGKIVQFMSPTVCMCSTMARIDPQHLAWTLENLVEGNVVNQIQVPERDAGLARTALTRMLDVV